MKNLSRQDLKQIKGGTVPESCARYCGTSPNLVMCTSDVGDCGQTDTAISCDGKSYACPPPPNS